MLCRAPRVLLTPPERGGWRWFLVAEPQNLDGRCSCPDTTTIFATMFATIFATMFATMYTIGVRGMVAKRRLRAFF